MAESNRSNASSLSAHYEQIIQEALAAFWRRRWLVLACMAIAMVFGAVMTAFMTKQYTVSALVHAGYAAPEKTTSDDKIAANVALDAALLVETRSRLFTTQQMARHVVDRLGLERLRSEVSSGFLTRTLQHVFIGEEAFTPEYQKDIAASKLLSRLTVKTEPRVYMITVSFSASDPDLAALIANAFVAEFLQLTALQTLSDQRSAAFENLALLSATLGDQHPSVLEARAKLNSIDRSINTQTSMSPAELLMKSGAATPAQPVYVPSSPDPKVMLIVSALLGFVVGIALATLIERGMLHFALLQKLWPATLVGKGAKA